ncbi:MAG: hypothetical protein MZV49_26120 [Rhodopseudomonas palustris]|nr:hypothetical protein [Rhodopseudomonas palustris]
MMLSVPFALVGGVWLMWVLDYNLSGRGRGRLHRAGRRGRRDRRGDADLPRPRLGRRRRRSARADGRQPTRGRPVRRGDGRRGRARAAEDDDRGRDHGRRCCRSCGAPAPAPRSCSALPFR